MCGRNDGEKNCIVNMVIVTKFQQDILVILVVKIVKGELVGYLLSVPEGFHPQCNSWKAVKVFRMKFY